jgi:Fe-S cluster assembly protein SufD
MSLKTRKQRCSEYFSFGGNLTRNNLNFYHFGERIVSYLNGITIIGEQHVDHYTLVQHATPIVKVMDYKGIFSDRSTGVFRENLRRKRAQKNKHSKKQ